MILVLSCSPHTGGVTDRLAAGCAAGCRAGSERVAFKKVRDYRIAPCSGCNACLAPPHACVQDTEDDQTAELFRMIQHAGLTIFVSPIYFYALPAYFKGFIDRAQKFWRHEQAHPATSRSAIVILSAGRTRGKLLFTGALRTISWFLKPLNTRIVDVLTFRGLDSVTDIAPTHLDAVYNLCLKNTCKLRQAGFQTGPPCLETNIKGNATDNH